MGTRAWHLERAKHNKKASDFLASQFVDWAVISLFYSALHYVQSSLADESSLGKDERHPRKHSGNEIGCRGTNQLVAAMYPQINTQYRSLMEMSHRTRYDVHTLGPTALPMLIKQWKDIKTFCEGLNQTRGTIPTQAP